MPGPKPRSRTPTRGSRSRSRGRSPAKVRKSSRGVSKGKGSPLQERSNKKDTQVDNLRKSTLTIPGRQVPTGVNWSSLAFTLVFVVTYGYILWLTATYLEGEAGLSTLVLSVLAILPLIVPMHHAVHLELTGSEIFDTCIGTLCGMIYITMPFSIFRSVHLHSHKKGVHEKAGMYPWTCPHLRRNVLVAPFLWATEDVHILLSAIRDVSVHGWGVILIGLIEMALPLYAVYEAFCAGYGWNTFYLWLLPARGGVGTAANWFGSNLILFQRHPHNEGTMTAMEANSWFETHGFTSVSDSKENVKRVPLKMPPRDEIYPSIAWMTVAFTVSSYIVWLLPVYLAGGNKVWWTVPFGALGLYIMFTPYHDAAHASVSFGKYWWLNEIVGRLCSVAFPLSPFPGWRYVHLKHHKETNMRDDPDMYAGHGPWYMLPLRWASQDFRYTWVWAYHIERHRTSHALDNFLYIIMLYSLITYGIVNGYGWDIVYFWILPSRISTFWLAYTFDYIPHRPHDETVKTNPYKATSRVIGFLRPYDIDLLWPMMCQSYHNIHHLYPAIPFNRYKSIWDLNHQKLRELGTPYVTYRDTNL